MDRVDSHQAIEKTAEDAGVDGEPEMKKADPFRPLDSQEDKSQNRRGCQQPLEQLAIGGLEGFEGQKKREPA